MPCFRKLYQAGATAIILLAGTTAMAQEKVIIANYGGMVADFYNRYCAPPLKERYNIELQQVAISDPLGLLKVQQATGNILWDMFAAEGEILVTASNNGWLEPIDWSVVDPNNEMPANGRHKYGVAGRVYSMIMAYRTDKVPAGKTVDGWKTFWDGKGFPGPRAMRDTPLENLEFALIATTVCRSTRSMRCWTRPWVSTVPLPSSTRSNPVSPCSGPAVSSPRSCRPAERSITPTPGTAASSR